MNPKFLVSLFVSLIISSLCQNEYRIIALWKYQKLNACKYTYYTFFNCVWWQICPCAEISCGIYTIYEKTPKNFSPNYLLFALHHNGLTSFLKVRQSGNDFFKPTFLPKFERTNSTLLLWYLKSTCFCSFFGRNWRHNKDISKLSDL